MLANICRRRLSQEIFSDTILQALYGLLEDRLPLICFKIMFTISDSGAAGNRQMVPGLLVLPEGNRANMNSYQQLKGNFKWFQGFLGFFHAQLNCSTEHELSTAQNN